MDREFGGFNLVGWVFIPSYLIFFLILSFNISLIEN
jgi:hypothetical protein